MERLLEKWPLLLIFAVLALVLVVVELRSAKRDRAPVYTERARLIEKHLSVEQIGGHYQTENRHIDELVFETVTGEVVKVRVARSASQSIEEDAEGVLTWQGDRLCRFEREGSQ